MNQHDFPDREARRPVAGHLDGSRREIPPMLAPWPARDGKEASWDLPPAPEAVATARRLVREALAVWGLSTLTDDLTVVVSEVVTNAIVHAKSAPTLSLHRQGRSVWGEVADHSPAWQTPLPAGPNEEQGRGLAIVAACSEQGSVQLTGVTRSCWFIDWSG